MGKKGLLKRQIPKIGLIMLLLLLLVMGNSEQYTNSNTKQHMNGQAGVSTTQLESGAKEKSIKLTDVEHSEDGIVNREQKDLAYRLTSGPKVAEDNPQGNTTYEEESPEYTYWFDRLYSGSELSYLCINETTDITYQLYRFYYDEYYNEQREEVTDFSDFTIEVIPDEYSAQFIKTNVADNRVTVTALATGWGSFAVSIKKDGQEVCTDYLEFSIQEESYILQYTDNTELPTTWYVGDTETRTLQLIKKYVENDQVITEEITQDVRFVWNSNDNPEEKPMDINCSNKDVTFTAKNKGYMYGRIDAYIGDSEGAIASTEGISFYVNSIIEDNGSNSQTIMVHEIQNEKLLDITVRGQQAEPTITNVTSGDEAVASVEKNVSEEDSGFTVTGLKAGTTMITVEYTVQDGEKTLSGTRTYEVNCKECTYGYMTTISGIGLYKLLPTEASEITYSLYKYYYDENHEYQSDEITDFNGFRFEVIPMEDSDALITTSVTDNKVTVTALDTGFGSFSVIVKQDENVVCRDEQSFSIQTERYILGYTEETKLPDTWYVGDTKTRTLQLIRKYVENNQVMTEEVTENVRFEWSSNLNLEEELMNINFNNKDVTFTAKNKGYVSGRIDAYIDNIEGIVASTEYFDFYVEPVISDNGSTNFEICVNQERTMYLWSISVRGEEAEPTITNVTSNDEAVVTVEKSVSGDNRGFLVTGLMAGTTTITIDYTVQDGEKTLPGSRTYEVNCKEYTYEYSSTISGTGLYKLLPTETSEITYYLNKIYYDKNHEYQSEEITDFSGFSFEVNPEDDSDSFITTSVAGNKVTATALTAGRGFFTVMIKQGEQVVCNEDQYFSIQAERYFLGYTDETELPYTWYVGDTKNRTLQLLKKYVENDQIRTEEVTEDVRFVWNSDEDTEEDPMNVSINNKEVTFTAKNSGYVYGRIDAYMGESEELLASIEDISFCVDSVIEDYYSRNLELCVNQNYYESNDYVNVRGKEVRFSITNVTSSDTEIASVKRINNYDGSELRITGQKVGTATVTVEYTVRDGEKDITGSRTYKVNCQEYRIECSSEGDYQRLSHLLPTQNSEIVFTASKVTYDENNRSHEEEFKDFTIDYQMQTDNDNVVQVSKSDNKLKITAVEAGSGNIYVELKQNDKIIYDNTYYYSVANQRCFLEYQGTKELYPKQVVSGPTFNRYYYEEGKIKQEIITDAVITCEDNNLITYNNGIITASDKEGTAGVYFFCKYKGDNYEQYVVFDVAMPNITYTGNLFEQDKLKLSIRPFPEINEEYSLLWSVKNAEGEESTDALATIASNPDGSATLSGIKPGHIIVTAIYKKGTEELWRAEERNLTVQKSLRSILENTEESICVNERKYITAGDFRINNTSYDTTITKVTSSDPNIVEVLNDTKSTNEDGYNVFSIYLKGKQVGDANIIIDYMYKNKDGQFIKNVETVKMTVDDFSYSTFLSTPSDQGVPGDRIPLSVKVRRYGYGEDGNRLSEDVDPSEFNIEYEVSDTSVATVEGNTLIFSTTANPGAEVKVWPIVKIGDNKPIEDYYSLYFNIVSSYGMVKGLSGNRIYIAEGETKTISPEFYLYDMSNPKGRKIEDSELLWRTWSYEEDDDGVAVYDANITSKYCSAKGMTITGGKKGIQTLTLAASYMDENNIKRYVTDSIYVEVIPEEIPVLTLNESATVTPPSTFYKITPEADGDYIVTSKDNNYPRIQVFNEKWEELGDYRHEDSEYENQFSLHLSLKADTTYYLRTAGTNDSGYFEDYTITLTMNTGNLPKKIGTCTIKVAEQLVYTGKDQVPTVTIMDGDYKLQEGTDYVLETPKDSSRIGEYELTIAGKGNYLGSVTKYYSITGIKLTDQMVQPYKSAFIYSGNEQKPEIVLKDGEVTLIPGTDYIIDYGNDCKNVGSYVIKVIGQGIYRGELSIPFVIHDKTSIASYKVILSKESAVYDGKQKAKPTITVTNGQSSLKAGEEYSLSYSGDYTNAGSHTITITGIGNYSGTITKVFTIHKASKVLAFTNTSLKKTYGEKAFTVALTNASVKTVQYTSSDTKVAKVDSKGLVTIVGAGKVTITAKYAGDKNYNSKTASYSLQVAKANNSITASNVIKTASTKKQTFKLKVTSKYKTTISYQSNNKAVTIKSGVVTIDKNFVGKVDITIKGAANANWNASSKKISLTVNPVGTKLASLKKSKNKIAIKWNKNTQVSGYEIQYSTDKNFKKVTTIGIKKSSTTSYQTGKLKTSKVYYVRIRTYKTLNKVKYYSGWSSVLKIKL